MSIKGRIAMFCLSKWYVPWEMFPKRLKDLLYKWHLESL
jgi:hypothetical protein